MLTLVVPAVEFYDEVNEKIIKSPEETLLLEHSLVSLSKWESITEKPFLGKEEKTTEETIEYIKLMTISPVNSPNVYDHLTRENFEQISKYIDAKMTATTFREAAGGTSRSTGEYVTNEIIYHWMIALNVPTEFQHWHLNRLLTLIRVLNLKNSPPKKMNRRDAAAQQRALNDQRRAQMNTNG